MSLPILLNNEIVQTDFAVRIQFSRYNILEAEVVCHKSQASNLIAAYMRRKSCGAIEQLANLPRYWDVKVGELIRLENL